MLEKIDINFSHVDEKIKETIFALFNIIEELAAENAALRREVQNLKDEINRLKGEQGKPKIKPNKKNTNKDISSEKERNVNNNTHKKREKRAKKQDIKIDRTETCKVDKDVLPPDAEFKGYQRVVVQGLNIKTDNIEFKKEVYYSQSEKKTYIAELPKEYEGEFDSTIKSLAIILKNVCNVSQSKILDFLQNVGVDISAGTISNILIKNNEQFHEEKKKLVAAGLESTDFQQIDDTKARVNGHNYHSHILCNPYYTAYTTTPKKNRLTVVEILKNGSELQYCLNQQAFTILEQLKIGEKYYNPLNQLESEIEFRKDEFEQLILQHFPQVKERVKLKIFEAAAIASYRKGADPPVVKGLVCDDAPQFKLICEELSLCWVHEGRHYKKLCPVVPHNAQKLQEFIGQFWDYYQKLLAYKEMPLPKTAELLSVQFDQLFSTHTDYKQLDDRISKTKAKKDSLLLVLKYPEIPLHNNASELAARVIARKRDVSLHTMTSEGTKANDTFLSIVETCKKLGVNPFEYIVDRISKKYQLPSLAQLIRDVSNKESLAVCYG